MRVEIASNRTGIYQPKKTESVSAQKSKDTAGRSQDTITISREYSASKRGVGTDDEIGRCRMCVCGPESARELLKEGDAEKLHIWMEEWKKENQLEVNRNAAADPDRSIYTAAYIESLVSQYEEQRTAIEAYYADAIKEDRNSPYGNDMRGSLLYLSAKYRLEDSPYFRSDLSGEERTMAYHQEYALLTGSSVNLADPYALASRGDVLSREKMDQIAKQAAEERVKGLYFSKTQP